MSRKKLNLTETKIEKMLLNGRGRGRGNEYQLWLKNGDYIECRDELNIFDFELTDKQEKSLNESLKLIKDFVLKEPDCYNKKIRSTFI